MESVDFLVLLASIRSTYACSVQYNTVIMLHVQLTNTYICTVSDTLERTSRKKDMDIDDDYHNNTCRFVFGLSAKQINFYYIWLIPSCLKRHATCR